MAEKPATVSRRLQRRVLEQFLPNPRAIKEFDALSQDVVDTLPDAIAGIGSDADSVLQISSFQNPRTPAMQSPAQADAILAGALFQQHLPLQPPVSEDDAKRILAGQIFGV